MKKQTTRREMLRGSAKLAGSAFLAQLFPASLLRAAVPDLAPQTPADLDATWAKGMLGSDLFVQVIYLTL
jgi:hypothetical protein